MQLAQSAHTRSFHLDFVFMQRIESTTLESKLMNCEASHNFITLGASRGSAPASKTEAVATSHNSEDIIESTRAEYGR